jgi:hypothetical protein
VRRTCFDVFATSRTCLSAYTKDPSFMSLPSGQPGCRSVVQAAGSSPIAQPRVFVRTARVFDRARLSPSLCPCLSRCMPARDSHFRWICNVQACSLSAKSRSLPVGTRSSLLHFRLCPAHTSSALRSLLVPHPSITASQSIPLPSDA